LFQLAAGLLQAEVLASSCWRICSCAAANWLISCQGACSASWLTGTASSSRPMRALFRQLLQGPGKARAMRSATTPPQISAASVINSKSRCRRCCRAERRLRGNHGNPQGCWPKRMGWNRLNQSCSAA
jgi:hypothetical protein